MAQYPNQTMELLFERASCRSFTDDKIPADVLEQVLEAGLHAPSAGNLQPLSIIKFENEETRQWLAEKGGQGFIGKAPVSLLFCLDLHRLERWAELEAAPFTANRSFRHFWVSFQDVIICAQTVCTAADAMGLGSVYIGTVLEFFADLKERCGLPQGVFPVVLLCLGYPKSRPEPRGKLGVDVAVHAERYYDPEDQALLDAFNLKYGGRQFEVTQERLDLIAEVCREVGGEELARRCLDRIEENGAISMVQRYFGLHYLANEMPKGNEAYLELMEQFGLEWFKAYQYTRCEE
ncbi:MAG: nitroreductase family protein [Anaerolineae bacterium]|nr:nitroreductase family protein [Anaerolineae bacterium]